LAGAKNSIDALHAGVAVLDAAPWVHCIDAQSVLSVGAAASQSSHEASYGRMRELSSGGLGVGSTGGHLSSRAVALGYTLGPEAGAAFDTAFDAARDDGNAYGNGNSNDDGSPPCGGLSSRQPAWSELASRGGTWMRLRAVLRCSCSTWGSGESTVAAIKRAVCAVDPSMELSLVP